MQVSRRQFLQGGAAAAASALVGPTLWRQVARAATLPGSPRLSYALDSSHGMTITWSTPEAVAAPRVAFGIDEAAGSVVQANTRFIPGMTTHYHTARITGLDPSTSYQYRLLHDGTARGNFAFTTAPSTAVPFRFTAFGDQGVNGAGARIAQLVAQEPTAFTLVAGDLCYANSSGMGAASDAVNPAVWDNWFAQNAAAMATAPFVPAMGNHDIERGLGDHGYGGHFARLGLPVGGFNEVIHALRYGNVAILTLDANDVSEEIAANKNYTGGGQDRWLASTLAALRADPSVDFIVAQYHHCSFCTIPIHASDAGPRLRWGPLFDRYAVDLVINGHNHGYERCHPIKGDLPTTESPIGGTVRPAEAGTTYVCAGGGGQLSYPAFTGGVGDIDLGVSYLTIENGVKEVEVVEWSSVRVAGNSYLRVDVTPPAADGTTSMDVTAVSDSGASIDRFTLVRTSNAARSAVAPGTAPSSPRASEATLPATGGSQLLAPAAATAAGAALALRLGRMIGPTAVVHSSQGDG